MVIYSRTASSAVAAPCGMEFLSNLFRFNVASPRARAPCIPVGGSASFGPDCRMVRQMRMTNGGRRFRELASIMRVRSATQSDLK